MAPEWLLWLISLSIGVIFGGALWYFLSQGDRYRALWSGTIGGMLLVLMVGLFIRNGLIQQEVAAQTPKFFGDLIPSNEDPLPPQTPPNVVSLLLGDDLQVLSASANQYVLNRQGVPLLSMGVDSGKLWISATVVDSEGRNIVRIVRNEFQAFPEGAFNPKQPDPHRLVVRDSQGAEVLNLRFLNPRRMRLTGRFYVKGFGIVEIDARDGLRFPGGGGIGHLTLDMSAAPQAGVIGF